MLLFAAILLTVVYSYAATQSLSAIFINKQGLSDALNVEGQPKVNVKQWLLDYQCTGQSTGDASGFPVAPSTKVEGIAVGDEIVYKGIFKPGDNNVKLAIFSDDGCDVTITNITDGTTPVKVLSRYKVGQALPSDASFWPLSVEGSYIKDKMYLIEVKYSNTCYLSGTDIDGCTLIAYEGIADVYGIYIDNIINNETFVNSESINVQASISGFQHTALNDVKLKLSNGSATNYIEGTYSITLNKYLFTIPTTMITQTGEYSLSLSAKYNGIEMDFQQLKINIILPGSGILSQYFDGPRDENPNLLGQTTFSNINCSFTSFPGCNTKSSGYIYFSGCLKAKYNEDYKITILSPLGDNNIKLFNNKLELLTKTVLSESTELTFKMDSLKGVYFSICIGTDNPNNLLPELKMKWQSQHQTEEIIPAKWFTKNIPPSYNCISPVINGLVPPPGDVNIKIQANDSEGYITSTNIKVTLFADDANPYFSEKSCYADIVRNSDGSILYDAINAASYSCVIVENLSLTMDNIHNYKYYAKIWDDLNAMTLVGPINFQIDKKLADDGTGLYGTYYNDGGIFKDLVYTRRDTEIAFDAWENGVRPPRVNNDNYGVKWFGKIQPLYSEPYTFTIKTKSYVKVYIKAEDDNISEGLLINKSDFSDSKSTDNPVLLDKNKRYLITVIYTKFAGYQGKINLYWQSDHSQNDEIIPHTQLFPHVPLRGHIQLPAEGATLPIYDNADGNPEFDLPLKTSISDDDGNKLSGLSFNVASSYKTVNREVSTSNYDQKVGYRLYTNHQYFGHGTFTQLQGNYHVYGVATDTDRGAESLIMGNDNNESKVSFDVKNMPSKIFMGFRQVKSGLTRNIYLYFDIYDDNDVSDIYLYTESFGNNSSIAYEKHYDNNVIRSRISYENNRYYIPLIVSYFASYNAHTFNVKITDKYGMITLKTYTIPESYPTDTIDYPADTNNDDKATSLLARFFPSYCDVTLDIIGCKNKITWIKEVDSSGSFSYSEGQFTQEIEWFTDTKAGVSAAATWGTVFNLIGLPINNLDYTCNIVESDPVLDINPLDFKGIKVSNEREIFEFPLGTQFVKLYSNFIRSTDIDNIFAIDLGVFAGIDAQDYFIVTKINKGKLVNVRYLNKMMELFPLKITTEIP